MKTNRYFQLVVIGIMLFVVSSCKTTLIDTPTLQSGELTVEEARNWYINKYSGLRTGQNEDGLERVIPWVQTQTIKGKSKRLYIYTPILYRGRRRPTSIISDDNTTADKKKMTKENLTIIEEGIIVYLNKNGEKEAKIVQFIPKDSKGGKNYNKPKDLSKYNGWVLIRDMSGNLIEGVEFDKGKGVRNFKAQDAKRLRTSNCYQVTLTITTWEISECGPSCIEFSTSQSTIDLGQYCINTGYNQDQLPPDFFVEGGGGEIGPVQAIIQLDYTDLSDKPCIEAIIKQALNKSLNPNQKNSIEKLIDGIYTNSTILDLKFRADDNIPYPGATIRRGDSNSGKTEIVFKPLAIDTFTKEYAVAIALHEFVHAILAYEDSFHTIYPDTNSEHVKMITDYLPQLAESLKAVTGLSDFDARAITLQGFNDIIQNNRVWFDEKVKGAFGAEFDVNQALSRGAQFSHYTENAQNGTGNRACD